MRPILIVDDNQSFRETLKETIEDLGYTVMTADGVMSALNLVRHCRFGLILIDFEMPGMNGLEGLQALHQELVSEQTPVVMLTSHVDAKTTVEAMKHGAADHLIKPLTRERLKSELNKYFVGANETSDEVIRETPAPDFELIGQSDQIREVLKLIGRVACTNSSVLVTGETGTGKEVVAQLIHRFSDRARAPFIAVNCAAIPDALLESELFGHSRGAFTGATSDRKGAFEQAAAGTLFLDEIGDMNLSLQAKLLRVLQERTVTPVGSAKAVSIDARFIAATHQSLSNLVESGRFRADLFFRLNVIEISLPPLRERKGDVEILARSFLAKSVLAKDQKKSVHRQLSPEAMAKLSAHGWPGNVRELKNTIDRALILSSGPTIQAGDIRFSSPSRSPLSEPAQDLHNAVRELEKQFIEKALLESNNNRSEAARRLGIGRQLLHTKMKEFGLSSPAGKLD